MIRLAAAFAVAALLLAAPPASAEVVSASPSAFVLHGEADVAASPEQAWRALGLVGRWWTDAHTYSGDASNMRIDMRAGGCWCERWRGGQVEHGRVVMMMDHEGARTLRIQGALGPFQEMGVVAILTYTVAPHANGAKITYTYRVTGEPGQTLDQFAAPTDGLMMEQFQRLIRYIGSGSPE